MLNDEGADSDTIAQTFTKTVHRHSLHTLRPETWLKDEVINVEMNMLNQKHADRMECCSLNSFFYHKVIE